MKTMFTRLCDARIESSLAIPTGSESTRPDGLLSQRECTSDTWGGIYPQHPESFGLSCPSSSSVRIKEGCLGERAVRPEVKLEAPAEAAGPFLFAISLAICKNTSSMPLFNLADASICRAPTVFA